MTFMCTTTTGRRCQAEESLSDLMRVHSHDPESEDLVDRHIREAAFHIETAIALLRSRERSS